MPAVARVEAGSVKLLNTTGQVGRAIEGGTGRLDIVANGANGADGLVSWQDGMVTVSGDEVTSVQAARGAVLPTLTTTRVRRLASRRL